MRKVINLLLIGIATIFLISMSSCSLQLGCNSKPNVAEKEDLASSEEVKNHQYITSKITIEKCDFPNVCIIRIPTEFSYISSNVLTGSTAITVRYKEDLYGILKSLAYTNTRPSGLPILKSKCGANETRTRNLTTHS